MANKFILFFAIFILLIHLSHSEKYYDIHNCQRTMYKDQLGPNCLKAKPEELTPEQQEEILKRHNHYRQLVKDGKVKNHNSEILPAADPSTLLPLVWDEELAIIAQRWAYQCIFDHDGCIDLGPKVKDRVGQNIAISHVGTTKKNYDFADKNIADLVDEWFDEHQILQISEISKFTNEGIIEIESEDAFIGHFTQLVWGDTRKVGCGAQKYYDAQIKKHSWLLVCNYNAGNVLGEPVYAVAGSNSNP